MKKILSIVLAITILMSLCSAFSVSYASETTEDGVLYYNDYTSESDLADIVFRSTYASVTSSIEVIEGMVLL